MARVNILLRLAVVACSVLLASGFVAYRAGAFNDLMGRNTPTPVDEAYGPSQEPYLIDGTSKSLRILDPKDVQQAAQPTTSSSRTMMSGSKSAAPLIPVTSGPSGSQAPAPSQAAGTPRRNEP